MSSFGMSVPDFAQLLSLGDDAAASPVDEDDALGKGDWFAQHVEFSQPRWAAVGQPAPANKSFIGPLTKSVFDTAQLREEHERQLELMAERFKLEDEQQA